MSEDDRATTAAATAAATAATTAAATAAAIAAASSEAKSSAAIIEIQIKNLTEKIDHLVLLFEAKQVDCSLHKSQTMKNESDIVRINDTVGPLRDRLLAIGLTAFFSASAGAAVVGTILYAFMQNHPK